MTWLESGRGTLSVSWGAETTGVGEKGEESQGQIHLRGKWGPIEKAKGRRSGVLEEIQARVETGNIG